jgi:hypothetical protein
MAAIELLSEARCETAAFRFAPKAVMLATSIELAAIDGLICQVSPLPAGCSRQSILAMLLDFPFRLEKALGAPRSAAGRSEDGYRGLAW